MGRAIGMLYCLKYLYCFLYYQTSLCPQYLQARHQIHLIKQHPPDHVTPSAYYTDRAADRMQTRIRICTSMYHTDTIRYILSSTRTTSTRIQALGNNSEKKKVLALRQVRPWMYRRTSGSALSALSQNIPGACIVLVFEVLILPRVQSTCVRTTCHHTPHATTI